MNRSSARAAWLIALGLALTACGDGGDPLLAHPQGSGSSTASAPSEGSGTPQPSAPTSAAAGPSGAESPLVMPPQKPVAGASATGLPGATPVRVAAVGDIACDPTAAAYKGGAGTAAGCQQAAVARKIADERPDLFLPLGDLQYESGSETLFNEVYARDFGQFSAITRPVPGNHEYKVVDAAGYWRRFGAVAEPASRGNYSFNAGGWHFVAINSDDCGRPGYCQDGSPMMRWLTADLARNRTMCTIAYWHHPLRSAGKHGEFTPATDLWNTAVDGGVDIVLNGHDHNYQRFAPSGRVPSPGADAVPKADGPVQFIVGTGGVNNYVEDEASVRRLGSMLQAFGGSNSQGVFGPLILDLSPGAYTWRFARADTPSTSDFADEGSGTC